MKIETKFNIGDEVFYMTGNKVKTGEVKSMTIKVYLNMFNEESMIILYQLIDSEVSENILFATKQELLDSL